MLPSFPCLIRNGLLFPENHLLQKGNECICKLRILFHIRIICNLKLQKLQDPPVFHARRQIQLSPWYWQINQGKVNYWLAQKVVNGRAENYTFKKCYDVQAIFKTFLCLKEGIVQVQTRCGRSYCTRLMQHLRIMMPHILEITIFCHSAFISVAMLQGQKVAPFRWGLQILQLAVGVSLSSLTEQARGEYSYFSKHCTPSEVVLHSPTFTWAKRPGAQSAPSWWDRAQGTWVPLCSWPAVRWQTASPRAFWKEKDHGIGGHHRNLSFWGSTYASVQWLLLCIWPLPGFMAQMCPSGHPLLK